MRRMENLPFCQAAYPETHGFCGKDAAAGKDKEEPLHQPEKHKAAEVSHRRLLAF
ncbi:hypothetical protein [Pannonibacter phragmitetus]|uniref:hypothetical protein n=1 Tax=Pannonibacter phragmitetus TaxID=121719 RepID=UPI000379E77D|nr:hypothetical protein [Pannonibacter phragmitetus]